MERAIIKSEDGKQYFFYDDPEWGVDYKKTDVECILDIDEETDFHRCERSALYEDMEGYIDEIQNENELPNGKYIVTYFKLCDNGADLEQCVDYGITKEQIIENINAQRYVEGADYFLMKD
jgi:hypothetical protein